MSCEFFIKGNFRAKTLALIEQANEILIEYAAQGFTLTVRQLYYQFVARLLLVNSVAEYGRLGRAISDGRRAGLVDWGHIEDRTRELETRSPIEVVRLGLNLAQVRDLRLPPNPAKETDTRHGQYVRDTRCTYSWELDALNPTFVDGLIQQAINDLVDYEAWRKALDCERANKTMLNRTAASFAETGGGP
jgi:hypothetical protein